MTENNILTNSNTTSATPTTSLMLSNITTNIEINELTKLFIYLIEICSKKLKIDEQQTISQIIQPIFTKNIENSSSFYRFLNPLSNTPKKIVKKKETTTNGSKNKVVKKKTSSKSPANRKRNDSIPETPPSRPSSSRIIRHHNLSLNDDKNDGKQMTQDDVIEKLLLAIEYSKDEMATIVLCRLLRGYAVVCKDSIGQRRLRRLVRLDAANHILRAMKPLFQENNPSPLQIMALDALSLALINVSAKDRKITLKIRLAGFIPFLTKRIEEAEKLWTTSTILKLICRCCLRSVRNAQTMGREKNFAEKLVTILSAYNSIEYQANIEAKSFINGENFTMSYEITSQTLLPFDTNEEFEIMAAANESSLKMARLIEILFLSAKNKRNKSLLIDKGVIPVLVKIYNNHFERRHVEVIHLEIAFITVAAFRQLIKIKKGKEELMNLNGLSLCESSIRNLREERHKIEKPFYIAALIQLQDSLCALCMRCLPQTEFPMEKKPFPLSYPLPSDKTIIATQASTTRKEQNSSLLNRTLRNSLTKSPMKTNTSKNGGGKNFSSTEIAADSALDDASPSSDEDGVDEEDESFAYFNSSLASSRTMNIGRDDDVDMLTPASEDDNDSDGNTVRKNNNNNNSRRILRSDSESTSKDNGDISILKYSSQKISELNQNYRQIFQEYENGTKIQENGKKHEGKNVSFDVLSKEHHQNTLSVGEFIKIPFPDLYEMNMDLLQQDLLSNPESMREAMIGEMARFRLENHFPSKIVYDLDQLILESNLNSNSNINKTKEEKLLLENNDLQKIGKLDENYDHLKFESRFESGNLRRAIQVAENHYELIISPDINQRSQHYQWFFFEVYNNKSNVPYTFEIINCLKKTSMFSHGMQPVLFSVTEASKGRPGWVRAGSSVCYYRNLYTTKNDSSTENDSDPIDKDKPKKKLRKSSESSNNNGKDETKETKGFYSTRFTIKFRHTADVCYIAYHYPYTYSFLKASLERIINNTDHSNVYLRQDKLATTIRGNNITVLTITSPGTSKEIHNREIIVYSARVHPGESNSSWIMNGLIKFLTSNSKEANKLRELFVFKIIPMLNPDGVINGSHRCSLAGIDLNRMWDRPNQYLHPTIYHSKGLIQYMIDILHKKPFVYVDLHGHSTRPNVFMFGNNPEESWRTADHTIDHNHHYIILPEYVSQIANGFSLKECRFGIAKSKESSARVTLWRQFGLERSYTMESTYCGFDVGPYAGKQIGITEHHEMGHKLAESLLLLKNYVDGNLTTTTTSGLNNESPPLALASVNSSDKTSNRRRSLGTTTPVNRTILRRANTFKSTTSLTK